MWLLFIIIIAISSCISLQYFFQEYTNKNDAMIVKADLISALAGITHAHVANTSNVIIL